MSFHKNKRHSLKIFALIGILASCLFLEACTRKRPPLGSEKNPIKFVLHPSTDSRLLVGRVSFVKRYLEAQTPYKYKFSVPTNYIATVESFGTKRADVASINAFGYIMAHDRYKTQARLIIQRYGLETYQSQIIARANGTIKSITDINGRRFAYVDPISTSGYLMPAKLFADHNIKPQETIFAQKHDNVVTMIYQGQVDAGATWYSPPHNGQMRDARRLVKTQYEDVEDKIKIIHLTDHLPNDPIVFRADLPQKIKEDIINALLNYISTKEGKNVFNDLLGATGFVKCSDSRYDSLRDMLKTLNKSTKDLL